MTTPIVTLELTKQLQQTETDFLIDRIRCLQKLPGNPRKAQIRKFNEVTVFSVPTIPLTYFNRVVGLSSDSLDYLDRIIAFYRQTGTRFQVDLWPGELSERLAERLAAYGFYQTHFVSALYGVPSPKQDREVNDIQIYEVKTQEAFQLFIHLFDEGFQIPQPHRSQDDYAFWYEQPGWYFFVATLEDVPCGAALLRTKNGIGHLAAAATIPSYRCRGVQSALIQHRIALAADLKCKNVCSETEFDSTSQRNLERAGMRLACTYANWQQVSTHEDAIDEQE